MTPIPILILLLLCLLALTTGCGVKPKSGPQHGMLSFLWEQDTTLGPASATNAVLNGRISAPDLDEILLLVGRIPLIQHKVRSISVVNPGFCCWLWPVGH